MSHYKNTNYQTAFVLTVVFPFGGLIYTLKHWRETWAKNTFWLACIYLGAVLIFWEEGSVLGMDRDGGRYVLRLMEFYESSISFSDIINNYLVDQDTMDLYFPIIAYVISRFTDNGHVLFAVCAFVFGYFYSRNVWYVLEKLPNRKLGTIAILVTLFFLINPITNINGIRYNTAAHIYVYAVLPYILEKDKSKLIWLIVVPLVHFSFLYVTLLAFGYVLITFRNKYVGRFFITVALIFFIASLFINSMNLSSMSQVLEEYSPETYEERINMYVNQDNADAVSERSSMTNWYIGASGIIKNWSYSLLLLLLFSCLKRNFKNGQFDLFYTFTLIFGAFANFMALIPSGGRFQTVSQIFMVSLFLLVAMRVPKNDGFKKAIGVAVILLLIPLVVDFRRVFDYYSVTAIMGNFITMFFWENNVPIIDWIKQII